MSHPETVAGLEELLAEYHPPAGGYDEMLGDDGRPRPHWRALLEDFAAMRPHQRQSAGSAAESLLREHDVAYITADGGNRRPWHLDVFPLVIAPADWQQLASGLTQRAALLNAVVADIYGDQELLRSGTLPPPLVFANPLFVPACHGYRAAGGVFLQFLAFDVARAADGTWRVLSQRSESPAGIGYTLENRIVTSRSIPEAFDGNNLHRLAGFFRTFAEHFDRLGDQHLCVVLTGGPDDEDYFEHALIGRYLGYPVVESADLTVRDNRVFLKTLEGLERVDVVLRRLPSETCDPLELRAHPGLGIAGLLQAARSGNVVLANAIGSGVAASDALMPFMPGLSRRLLGEELKLPGIATWWCGQAPDRAHVLENAPHLSLRRAFTRRSLLTAGAADFAASEHDLEDRVVLERLVELRPYDVVGVDRMRPSTAPCLTPKGLLRPMPMVMRVYLAATGDGYQVLPGGLAKVPDPERTNAGRFTKDVWVLSDQAIERETLIKPLRAASLERSDRDLPSKTADDLFWLGRYFERADGGVLRNVARTADHVRERLSADAWRIIERLTSVPNLRWRVHTVSDAVKVLNDLVEAQSAVNGLIHENMTRGYGWRLLDMGRRIERARFTIRVMRELLVRADRAHAGVLGLQLELADSLITYRSRYRAEPQIPAVLDLVLADESNPRSLAFQLQVMRGHMDLMPLEHLHGQLSRARKILISAHTEVILADVDKLAGTVSSGGNRTHLKRLLNRCEQSIETLTEHLTQTYFSHSVGHRTTGNMIRENADDAL